MQKDIDARSSDLVAVAANGGIININSKESQHAKERVKIPFNLNDRSYKPKESLEGKLRKLKEKSNQSNEKKPKSLVRKILSYIGAFALVAAVGISYLSNKKIDNKLQQITAEKNILEKQIEDYSIQLSGKEVKIKEILVKNEEYESRVRKLSKQLETEREKSMQYEQQAEEYNIELEQVKTELGQSLDELSKVRTQNEEYENQIEEQFEQLKKEKEKSKFSKIEYMKCRAKLNNINKKLTLYLDWLNGMVRLAAGDIKEDEEKIKEYKAAIPFLEKVKEGIGDYWLNVTKFRLEEALKEKEKKLNSAEQTSKINLEAIDWDLVYHLIGNDGDGRKRKEAIDSGRYHTYVITGSFSFGSDKNGALSYGINSDWLDNRYMLTGGLSNIENGGEHWQENPYYKWGNEFGPFFGAGLRVKKYSDLFLLATLGTSFQFVKDGDSTFDRKDYFNWSAELRYMYKHLVLGCGYHNRRGVIAGVGVGF